MASGKNQSVSRMSPRQKMINLMYIVLTAMLALNVSSDVLNGFSQVADGLERSNRTITARNIYLYQQLQEFNKKHPGKGKVWLDQATQVRAKTDVLYSYIDSLKYEIVKVADGEQADVSKIINRDNLEAASQVMLAPGTGKGKDLRERIDAFRKYIISFLNDHDKRTNVASALSTAPLAAKDEEGENTGKLWEESMFENMPTIAAVTLLSKLQNDVRYAEGEVLSQLLASVDTGDLRVNLVDAFVVPQSRVVMRGSKYSANIVMAAVDTTQRPVVYVNGHRLNNNRGLYEVGTGAAGNYEYSGYIEVMSRDGSITRRNFKSSYTVIDPLATVSATMMNVLYAGIDNPISIAVPGVPESSISATMTNGTLTKSGNGWIAHSSQVGAECEISVSAEMDGVRTQVGTTKFRVRKLPDPLPYIIVGDTRFKGGRPLAKASLLSSPGLGAAIDDGILDIKYNVLSFETVMFDSMGNAMPEISSGSSFSQRQRDAMKQLKHGKRFYITRIKASGPDGITRDLPPIEVIVN